MFELSCGQLGLVIACFVFGVATVTTYPAAGDRLLDLHQGIETLPKIEVFQVALMPARTRSPALGFPFRQTVRNALNDVGAIADNPDVAWHGDLFQAVDDRQKFCSVVGSPGNCTGAPKWPP